MKLTLVSDNPEPGSPDYGNIPEMLRQYAGEIQAGVHGELLSVVLVLERVIGPPETLSCGEQPTAYEVIGLLEAAKITTFRTDIDCGDE